MQDLNTAAKTFRIGAALFSYDGAQPLLAPGAWLRVQAGTHWMVTPFRELTLVHAVRQPLLRPKFTSLAVSPARALAATFAAVSAFALPLDSLDAALVLTLAPGPYTARVNGTGAGEVIVEVYFVD